MITTDSGAICLLCPLSDGCRTPSETTIKRYRRLFGLGQSVQFPECPLAATYIVGDWQALDEWAQRQPLTDSARNWLARMASQMVERRVWLRRVRNS